MLIRLQIRMHRLRFCTSYSKEYTSIIPEMLDASAFIFSTIWSYHRVKRFSWTPINHTRTSMAVVNFIVSTGISTQNSEVKWAVSVPDCVECMAGSDNVIRAALTSKLRDVAMLCKLLNYSSAGESKRVQPHAETDNSMLYKTPAKEFAVCKVEVNNTVS